MYKKIKLQNHIYSNDNYEKMNYTGAAGILFRINHFLLELNADSQYHSHIIEVGGGAKLHLEFIKNKKKIKSYTLVDDIFFKKNLAHFKRKYKSIHFKFVNFKNKSFFKKNKFKFTRLISSHSFEHIHNFEDNFIKFINLMKHDSLISIALPCDPGGFWRILQYLSYIKQKKIYKWKSFREKDLDDSRDHVNPAQNILKVLKFYFKKIKFIYFPFFFLPLIFLNIFVIIQIKTLNYRINSN